jgi:hypothetical protein
VRVLVKKFLGTHDIYSKVARSAIHVVPRNGGGEGVYLPWYSSTFAKMRARASRDQKMRARRLLPWERAS